MSALRDAPSQSKVRDLRDRNFTLACLAIVRGAPVLAKDAAKNCAHFARILEGRDIVDEPLLVLTDAEIEDVLRVVGESGDGSDDVVGFALVEDDL